MGSSAAEQLIRLSRRDPPGRRQARGGVYARQRGRAHVPAGRVSGWFHETRAQGVVTFGVFLGKLSDDQQRKLTELFGTNNWRPIAALTELPQVVGQRIADIFEALGGDE